ncbi:MAG TPA: DegT/DnrJ/EryC1/StrS family aminotransferase [Candidatus Nanoarchaeia archaeon]|nr:DegT/DnrJ/EryC1/StrS family aminotransferase [Candidatus Nanoarchaeia archaeon]
MKIEFGDLKISEEAVKHLEEVIKSNRISGGTKVKRLENSWGELFGYKYNLAVSSGTSADIASCIALYDFGAKPGDEIIAPACAFAAVGNSIRAAGFKPAFVDIKRETLNINSEKIEEKINSKTRAIMAVHTMGKPCEMDSISNLAKKYNLKIIEDCCEAHGGKYKDNFVGTFGDIATFSFYVAHIVSCGDGGMISTNNKEIFDVLTSIKYHGRKPDSLYFDHLRYGLNFRINDLTASIGIPEIEKFRETFNKRKDNFYYLKEKTKYLEDLVFFVEEDSHEILSPHAFSITLKSPRLNYSKLYKFLESNDVQCKRNFGSMPTQHKAFEYLGHKLGEFPEAEYVGDNGLHFGIHQYLSKKDLDYVSDKLHEYFNKF